MELIAIPDLRDKNPKKHLLSFLLMGFARTLPLLLGVDDILFNSRCNKIQEKKKNRKIEVMMSDSIFK
jgi:hypothetical protein